MQLFSVAVREGDMIIAATDGASDNLFPAETAKIAITLKRRGGDAHMIAGGLAHYARKQAEDTERLSPFALGAQQHGHNIKGGKLDDITVVVAQCVRAGGGQPSGQSKL